MSKQVFGAPYVFHLATTHHAGKDADRLKIIRAGVEADRNNKKGFHYLTYSTILGDIHTVHQFVGLESLDDLFPAHPRELWTKVFGQAKAEALWREHGEIVTAETQSILRYEADLSDPPPTNGAPPYLFYLMTRHHPNRHADRKELIRAGVEGDKGGKKKGYHYFTFSPVVGDVHCFHQFAQLNGLGDLFPQHPSELWKNVLGADGERLWGQYVDVVKEEGQSVLKYEPELSDPPK